MSGSSGQGTVAVVRDTSASLSAADDQNISALLCGTAWSGTNISFSFPALSTDYGTAQGNGAGQYSDPAPFNGFSQFTLQEIGETLRAFGLIASYTNMTFSQITESTTTHATVRLANSTSPATSYAYNPSTSPVGGDVFLGPSAANPIMGNYASGAALIHEIGHALGLVHGQGDFDKNNNLLNPYGVMNPNQLDIEYSLMNYPSYVGGPNLVTAGTLPQTYMMYDIAAFQYMYGANYNQVGQNNTYTWSTTTGEEFINGVSQGAPVDNHIFATVWTGGANSTYDLSDFSADQADDMNPGGWMLFSPAQRADLNVAAPGTHVAQGDIYNALEFNGDRRSLIGNLFTGSGNDTITGNAADNTINSGAGSDTINAGGGANTITGGSGADKFVIDASLLPSGFDDIRDYDQGNNGSFATSEGDQIDLSALLFAAYNKGVGAAVTSLVRSVKDPGGLFTAVQIYTGGAISSWTTVAELFGVTATEAVNVILDASLPAGSSVTTTGELLEFTGFVDNNWDGHLTDKNSGALIHTNWTADLVPVPNDDLVIAHSQSVILDQQFDELGHAHTYDSLGIEAGSSLAISGTILTLDNSAGNSGVALTNQGTISDTYKFEVDGNIHNGGLITLQSNGPNYFNFSFLFLGGTDVTLDGGGSIVLQAGNNNANEITGAGGAATTLHNVDNTISGIGSVGAGAVHPNVEPHNALDLDNQAGGTIDAGAGNSLLVSTPIITNAGTLEATAGGALTLLGSVITQTGAGVILANGLSSHVDLSGVTIAGGVLSTSGGGVINAVAGTKNTLDGSMAYGAVTNSGLLLVNDVAPLILQGTIHNTGTIALQSGGPNYFNFSLLQIGTAGVVLDGGGSIALLPVQNRANEITGNNTATNAVLINVDNTISGIGAIGQGALHPNKEPHDLLSFTNRAGGIVNASGGNLILGSLTVANAGTLEASVASGLILQGRATISQTGGGTILANGADAHVDLNGVSILGGVLSTSGGGVINAVAGTANVLDGSTGYGGVTNAGALFVGGGAPLLLQGTIHNGGTITVATNGPNYFNFSLLQIGTAGVVLDGLGSVVLQATGNNANQITGVSSAFATTLHNAGTISGVGAIGQGALHPNVEPHDKLVFENRLDGTVDADSVGNTLTINTGATITNDGTLAADGGILVVDDPVIGGGHVLITGDGSVRINSSFQQNVTFSGAGTLVLPEAAAAQGGYIGHIAGWSDTDTVDVPGVGFSSNDRVLIGGAGGGALSLFVVDSADNNALIAQMNLTGTYVSRNFSLSASQDGLAIAEHAAGPVPIPSGLALSPASDSGVPGDNITSVAMPVFTGTGEAGDTVTLDDGATAIGSATVAGNGAWSITPTQALAIGAHSLTAQQTDLAGNASTASAPLNLTIVSPLPQQSPIVLNDFGWAQGWGSPNNPRLTADVDRNGATDYVGFGFQAVFVSDGGTFSDGQGHNGPGFTAANFAVNDFGTAEGYTADVQRGVAFTGNPFGDTIYGQGFVGVYWYAPTGATPQPDQGGKTYDLLQYQPSANLYGNFGSQEGWTPHNGFQILKTGNSDSFASILGFGAAGIVVGPQAFGPGATAADSYTISGAMGNNSGWDQQVDIRTFTDANGNTLDLNHDGAADFVGMGPQGLVYAFGNSSEPGGAYGLGPLQTAHIGAGNTADLGEAQGWSDAVTLRYIVSDPQTGFDDILAFGAPGVFVSMGQDPATHGGEAFGQLYLAMPDFGSDQGWSVQQTPRIVGDVNGDGIPDIVGFGANSTFAAIGSRDAGGHLQFALDMTRTINDFGFNEDWSGSNPQTIRTLGNVAGTGHSDLILSGAFNTQIWAFN